MINLKYMGMVAKDFQEYAKRKHDPEGETLLANEWRDRQPKTEEEYIQFYKDCNFLDELVAWHSRSNKHPKAIQTRKVINVVQALPGYNHSIVDLGAGIGSDSLELAALGHNMFPVEPNAKSVDFMNWRVDKYGLRNKIPVPVVGTEENISPTFHYDIILFLEVIEHFYDPFKSIDIICSHEPNFLLFTQSFGVHEEERGGHPQHTDFSMKDVAKRIIDNGYHKVKLTGIAFPPQLWAKSDVENMISLNCAADVKVTPKNTFRKKNV